MSHKVVELGKASMRTQDFSGTFWWDAVTFSFRSYFIIW
jgi:hypothetical protein